MKKRIICMLLSFVLAFSMVITSFADANEISKNDKTNDKDIEIDRVESYEGSARYPSVDKNENDEVKDDNSILRENPPANWQYGGSTTYNQYIRDVIAGTIAGVLATWFGGDPVTWKSVAGGLLAGAASGSISATLWAQKSVYYKLNYNGNGYPYYCQEIVETWLDPDHGTSTYTTVKYFYSYQPY